MTADGRIVSITRVVADLGRAESFYHEAFAFESASRMPADPAALDALGLAGAAAQQCSLQLGSATINLLQFAEPGAPYPPDSNSNDLWFQHIAVVVSDMDRAYAHLQRCPGWQPITAGAPPALPPENGSVRAFKLRDPDGHPVELIWFPHGHPRALEHDDRALFQGVDHSALAVSSTEAALVFYRSLGFAVGDVTFNHGPAQSRLDGLAGARVRVTPLRLGPGLGLELLGYDKPGRTNGFSARDRVTDWITLAADRAERTIRLLRDPDGHRVILV